MPTSAAASVAPSHALTLLHDGGIIGESPAMANLALLVSKIADSEATVLIAGESGTGKELVARALHKRSRRTDGPFVAINCAAVPETLLESELFGHVRGAFTNATSDKKGLFEQATTGTLFLDELAEIPPGMQAKLLRALQERRIRPVGGGEERPVDVRLVGATNKRLEEEVRVGRFREDLYYRLNVVTLEVPPLRQRGNDVLMLARHFMDVFGAQAGKPVRALSEECAEALLAHEWPGNVRELRNCIERAVALTDEEIIPASVLPPAVRAAPEQRISLPPITNRDSMPTLGDVEQRYIRYVLERLGHNKTRAAEVLGIDRRTLHRKLSRMRARNGGEVPT